MTLRRSDMSNIERARSRTLRMTLIIVIVFIWCWTPYVVMTLWLVPFFIPSHLFLLQSVKIHPLIKAEHAFRFFSLALNSYFCLKFFSFCLHFTMIYQKNIMFMSNTVHKDVFYSINNNNLIFKILDINYTRKISEHSLA